MPYKIAFIDDEASILASLRWIFKDEPYDAYTFQNPLKALEETDWEDFAVVVADQTMPEMEGSTFLKKIKERYPKTECIIMSARDNYHNIKDVTDRVIVKPWDIALLKTYIKNAVTRYEKKCLETEEPSLKKKRILFIDDDPYIIDFIQPVMEHLGYEIVITTRGNQAIRLLKSQPDRFDIVITDMNMPNMNGLELSKELLHIRSDLPIILCTGQGLRGTHELIREAGVRAVLTKPFSMDDIDKTIKDLFNNYPNPTT